MKDEDFEGTLVLETLAERDLLDSFWEAIDSDDFSSARKLMTLVGIPEDIIQVVIVKMKNADGDH